MDKQQIKVDEDAGAASNANSLGKGLLNLAKASAREAGRGARLAQLKTQLEKLKLVDLAGALAALGAKAFELRALADVCGPVYAEIEIIDESVKTKRDGVAAKADAGFSGKAKAAAVSMKLKAEAEALGRRRKNKCAEVGKIIVEQNPAIDELVPLLGSVRDVQRRIDDLDKQFDVVADDRTGRDAFASSARSLGADAKAAAKSPLWKGPLGRIVLGVVALTLIVSVGVLLSAHKQGKQGSAKKLDDTALERLQEMAGMKEGGRRFITPETIGLFLEGYCDSWIQLSDHPPQGDTLRDPVSLYLTHYKAGGDVPTYAINDYDVISVDEYGDSEQREIGFEQAFRFTIRVHLRANSGATIGTKKISGYVMYDADNYSTKLII